MLDATATSPALEKSSLFGEWFEFSPEKSPVTSLPKTESRLSLSQHQSRMLGEIQIPLAVQLGTVTLSAASVIDLLPGQILSYPLDPEREVTLSVGNDRIATARLVQVNGELALEIVEVCFLAENSSET